MTDLLLLAIIEDDLVTLSGRVHRLLVQDVGIELERLDRLVLGENVRFHPLVVGIGALRAKQPVMSREAVSAELLRLSNVAARISRDMAPPHPTTGQMPTKGFDSLADLIASVNRSAR